MTTDFAARVRDYLVLVEGGPPSNFSAWSPDVPGCVGVGATVDDCVADMLSALTVHLEGLAADGGPIPVATGPGVYVEQQSLSS